METNVRRPSAAPEVPARRDGPVVITGGAGFVGANLADRILSAGRDVVVLDRFARRGVEANARWLAERHGDRVRIQRGDVRDRSAVAEALDGAAAVFHFAAQVAVTSSLEDPRDDFEVNLMGTFNVLEELRRREDPPPFVYTSTNKVYGGLDLALTVEGDRYVPVSDGQGLGETARLDFLTPYGCSKGAADQYALEYARAFGVPALVFRMSCIYGPRQFGTEDQGWVAYLAMCALAGLPITIYGDGRQVRDVLFVEDLVDAFLLAWSSADRLSARAFNIGGGPLNTISLLELLDRLAMRGAKPRDVRFASWRSGDQRYYVSDISSFRRETGWQPRVGVAEGLDRLLGALEEQRRREPERAVETASAPGVAP